MIRIVVLIFSSLLVIPLIRYLAAAADARAAGNEPPAVGVIWAGVVIAVLFPVAGMMVLVRPAIAATLFIIAGMFGFLGDRDEGLAGLAVYGLLSLPLAALSFACSWRHLLTWLRDGHDL
jgi:hypothetical protein